MGFPKKGSRRRSITRPKSVDEALCCGWIDGIRRGVDAEGSMIRFTPRKPGSVWSGVDVGRVQALTELGRVQPAGLVAHEARKEARSGIDAHEEPDVAMPEPYRKPLRAELAA